MTFSEHGAAGSQHTMRYIGPEESTDFALAHGEQIAVVEVPEPRALESIDASNEQMAEQAANR